MFSPRSENDLHLGHSDEETLLTPSYASDDFGNNGSIQPWAPAQKVSELSYEDQNLAIFQAGEYIFQLPETPFTRKSGVFSEFLQNLDVTRQSEHFQLEDSSLLNDQHVYILLDVTGKEAHYFLTALYDAGYFEPPPAECTVEMALAILKLSTRYEVEFLRRRALAHLESGYPMSLKAWDNRTKYSTFPLENRDFGQNILMKSTTLHETLAVIKVAVSCNAQWLLPAASYELGMHNIHALVHHPNWRTLHQDVKAQLEIGRTLQGLGFRKIFSFLNIPRMNNICSNSDFYACVEARRKTRQKLDEEQWDNLDPLHVWDDEDWEAYAISQESCDPCLGACKSKHERDRQHFWNSLPEIYGWSSWDELRALKVIGT